jgi:hypothetical protein
LISPAFPPVADPVSRNKDPDDPALLVPDVKDSFPLTPEFPALLVCTMKSPLDRAVPTPDEREIVPPDPVLEAAVLSPLVMTTSPPIFDDPTPTAK